MCGQEMVHTLKENCADLKERFCYTDEKYDENETSCITWGFMRPSDLPDICFDDEEEFEFGLEYAMA